MDGATRVIGQVSSEASSCEVEGVLRGNKRHNVSEQVQTLRAPGETDGCSARTPTRDNGCSGEATRTGSWFRQATRLVGWCFVEGSSWLQQQQQCEDRRNADAFLFLGEAGTLQQEFPG